MSYTNFIGLVTISLLLLNIIVLLILVLKPSGFIERSNTTLFVIIVLTILSTIGPSIIISSVFRNNYEVTYKGKHNIYDISFNVNKVTVAYIDGESIKSKDIDIKDIKLIDGDSYVECEKREYKFLNNGDGDIELYLNKEYKPTDMTSITK